MESIYSSSTHFTRVDGTLRPYRYFSNHDDKVVTLGPREVEFGTVKQPGGRSSKSVRRDDHLDRSR
jgi:hypothetical protein